MSECEHDLLEPVVEESTLGAGWTKTVFYLQCEGCGVNLLCDQQVFLAYKSLHKAHSKLREEVKALSDTVDRLENTLLLRRDF